MTVGTIQHEPPTSLEGVVNLKGHRGESAVKKAWKVTKADQLNWHGSFYTVTQTNSKEDSVLYQFIFCILSKCIVIFRDGIKRMFKWLWASDNPSEIVTQVYIIYRPLRSVQLGTGSPTSK